MRHRGEGSEATCLVSEVQPKAHTVAQVSAHHARERVEYLMAHSHSAKRERAKRGVGTNNDLHTNPKPVKAKRNARERQHRMAIARR
jgi:hypothetical protein